MKIVDVITPYAQKVFDGLFQGLFAYGVLLFLFSLTSLSTHETHPIPPELDFSKQLWRAHIGSVNAALSYLTPERATMVPPSVPYHIGTPQPAIIQPGIVSHFDVDGVVFSQLLIPHLRIHLSLDLGMVPAGQQPCFPTGVLPGPFLTDSWPGSPRTHRWTRSQMLFFFFLRDSGMAHCRKAAHCAMGLVPFPKRSAFRLQTLTHRSCCPSPSNPTT